jgi:hypothetical protein
MISSWTRIAAPAFLAALILAAPVLRSQETAQPAAAEERPEKAKKPAAKKSGGFFTGLKAVTGEGGEQQADTRTAGSKTVGEGEEIGDVQPGTEHRRAVEALEKYKLPRADVDKFKEEGGLKP